MRIFNRFHAYILRRHLRRHLLDNSDRESRRMAIRFAGVAAAALRKA